MTSQPRSTSDSTIRAAPYSVVATDLDGTLLRSDRSVSGRTVRSLRALRRARVRHVVVTGRPAASCRAVLESLDYDGLAVCGQGTQIFDHRANRLVWSTNLDRELARAVLKTLTDELGEVAVGAASAGLGYTFLMTPGFTIPVLHSARSVPNAEAVLAGPVEKLLLTHPNLSDVDLAAHAERLCGGVVAVTHSDRGVVELLPPGVHKGAGLARVGEYLGFTDADTVAFGDMPNDIGLLEWAALGVAVGNAHPDVIAVADRVAPTNDEDGVAHVLDDLFS